MLSAFSFRCLPFFPDLHTETSVAKSYWNKRKEKSFDFLMDTPPSPAGLFGDTEARGFRKPKIRRVCSKRFFLATLMSLLSDGTPPLCMVPISPLYSQGADLPTPTYRGGTEVPSEFSPKRGLLPLRSALKQSS